MLQNFYYIFYVLFSHTFFRLLFSSMDLALISRISQKLKKYILLIDKSLYVDERDSQCSAVCLSKTYVISAESQKF